METCYKVLLLLVLPAAVQSQDFDYSTNYGTITITGLGSSSGAAIIPSTITGLPVTDIGVQAFLLCSRLTSVTIPDSVTNIWTQAFQQCTSLTNVTMGTNIATIGYAAFCDCMNLASITIPDSVTSINGEARDRFIHDIENDSFHEAWAWTVVLGDEAWALDRGSPWRTVTLRSGEQENSDSGSQTIRSAALRPSNGAG
jgi:hypothetical protein